MIESLTVQRRFPRIFLTGVLRGLKPLENCKVIWPSGFESDVFDFGRSSASVYFPMRLGLNFSKDEIVKLGWRLGKNDAIFADCRVIRGETRLLTVEHIRLTSAHYKLIDKYFTNDFIATHLQEIHKRNFAPEQTFDFWFHGPMDTNIYIWKGAKGPSRVSIELGETVLGFEGKTLSAGPSRDTLSYPTEDYAYYANFLSPLKPVTHKSDEYKKVSEFLKHVTVAHPIVGEANKFLRGE
jgi:hypothetical protein